MEGIPSGRRCFLDQGCHARVQWRFDAGGIGGGSVSCNRHRLTATAAPVYFLAVAGAARLCHPVRASKGVECRGTVPDVGQAFFAETVENETGYGASRMTRKNSAVRRHHEGVVCPAAHAGLGVNRKIIGCDEIDSENAVKPFLRFLHDIHLVFHGGTVRHQGIAVEKRPAGILNIGDLQPLGVKFERQFDEGRDLIDIVAVDRSIDRQGQASCTHLFGCPDLLDMRIAIIADLCGGRGDGALKTDLDMIQPRSRQIVDPSFANTDAGSDQVCIDAAIAQAADQSFEIRP
ncbi:hypothetical protein D3C80_479200 [compost metagenome]